MLEETQRESMHLIILPDSTRIPVKRIDSYSVMSYTAYSSENDRKSTQAWYCLNIITTTRSSNYVRLLTKEQSDKLLVALDGYLMNEDEAGVPIINSEPYFFVLEHLGSEWAGTKVMGT